MKVAPWDNPKAKTWQRVVDHCCNFIIALILVTLVTAPLAFMGLHTVRTFIGLAFILWWLWALVRIVLPAPGSPDV